MEELTRKISELVEEEGLTVKETLSVLDNCQSQLLRNMPLDKNLDSKVNWFL